MSKNELSSGPGSFKVHIYAEKATKFCEISSIDLPYVVTVKYTEEILQNFVAFLENTNFK